VDVLIEKEASDLQTTGAKLLQGVDAARRTADMEKDCAHGFTMT
jgi:hypothetical protein